MDGVPVKISEKYKPPKRISLPGSVVNKINFLQEAKIEDYDFSFERSVLAQIGKINEHKKSVQEKKKKITEDNLRQLEEASERLSLRSQELQSSASVSPPSPPSESEPVQYVLPSSVSTNMNMLAPLPVTNTALVKEKRKVDNAILSEFESDTSSPFDNVELKSINDLKELADVLGSSNTSKLPEAKEEKPKPLNGITHQWQNKASEQNPKNYVYPCQYYPGMYGVPSMYHGYLPQVDRSYQRYVSDYNHYQPTLSPPYVSPVPPPLPPKPASLSSNPTTSSPAHSYRYPAATVPVPLRPQDYTHPSPSRQMQLDRVEAPPRTDSAEVSLWSDLQKTIYDRRTNILVESTSKPVISSTNMTAIVNEPSSIPSSSVSNLPNPLTQLSPESQALARRMSEMGFPLARSARAVHTFVSDEAKVIEFLLQVQNLEDRGFPGDLVENALSCNDYKEDSTLKYLENVKKLMDFGFNEEKVQQAMKQSNNDPDQALDLLIS